MMGASTSALSVKNLSKVGVLDDGGGLRQVVFDLIGRKIVNRTLQECSTRRCAGHEAAGLATSPARYELSIRDGICSARRFQWATKPLVLCLPFPNEKDESFGAMAPLVLRVWTNDRYLLRQHGVAAGHVGETGFRARRSALTDQTSYQPRCFQRRWFGRAPIGPSPFHKSDTSGPACPCQDRPGRFRKYTGVAPRG